MEDRSWMYRRLVHGIKGITDEFKEGVKKFTAFACGPDLDNNLGEIRCPCSKCKNMKFKQAHIAREHLYRHGFVSNYYNWTCHGEPFISDSQMRRHQNIMDGARECRTETSNSFRLEKLHGRKFFRDEVFEYRHKLQRDKGSRKKGGWVDSKAQQTYSTFQESFDEASQEASTAGSQVAPELGDQLFIDATGGKSKKGRIYGLGSRCLTVGGDPSFTSVSTSTPSYEAMKEQLTQEIEQQVQQRVEEQVKQRVEQLQIHLQQQMELMLQARFGTLMGALPTVGPSVDISDPAHRYDEGTSDEPRL